MIMQEDAIVDIPENRVKFFGTTGKMLLPCPATLEAVIHKVPENKLLTTELLRQELADQFDVEGVCPITTQNSLRALANDPTRTVAYWRVINSSGGLFAHFPGGMEGHAAHLQQEGFSIDKNGKLPKVKQFKQSLVHFG
ncbi:MAG: hypothetical protein K8L97_31965 [Anaerolineae bacterium]|nr:hypothetical protein [Anaerolineae bacterium]